MADQTDLMDVAVDSAVAAFDVFVAGETEDGSRLLTFDPRTPVSATVVWREGAPDALLTVAQAEAETPGIAWYALPPPAVAPRTAAAEAPPEDAVPVEAPKVDEALVARQQATLDEVEERIGEIEGRIAAVMLRSMTDDLFDDDEPEVAADDEAKTASAGFVEPLGLVLARLAALGEPGNEAVEVRIEELSGRLDALEAAVADLLADSGPDEDLDLPDPTATTVDETLPRDEQGGGHIAAAGRPKPRPFDPSKFGPGRPVDADGDGFVYDGTIRQRPALPPLPKGNGLAIRAPGEWDDRVRTPVREKAGRSRGQWVEVQESDHTLALPDGRRVSVNVSGESARRNVLSAPTVSTGRKGEGIEVRGRARTGEATWMLVDGDQTFHGKVRTSSDHLVADELAMQPDEPLEHFRERAKKWAVDRATKRYPFSVGDTVDEGGRRWTVTGYTESGNPLVRPIDSTSGKSRAMLADKLIKVVDPDDVVEPGKPDGLALRPPPAFDVDAFVADHPRQPGENFFDWQGRIVADLPPQLQSDVLFKTREVYPPSKFIADGIARWQTEHGLPPLPDNLIDTPVDLEEADDVARFFEGAPDMSDDPDVRAAYEDFKAQSAEQWDFMTRPESEGGMGITVDFTDQVDPYATAEEQRNDLEQNHHLTIQSGLGGDHSGTMTQEEYDRFRAVHDVFGHAGIGSGFDRHGEYEAWLVHAAMYRGQGRRAMSTEYHGVNSAMWTGAPGSPGTGKSVLLPDEFGEPPWLRADKLGGYSDSYLLQLWYSKDQTPQLRAELVSRGILPKAAAVDDVDDVDDGSQPDSSDPVDRLIELLGLTDKFAALFDTLPLHELPEDEDR